MRQVVLDTETTGIGPEHGHRIIEIGCVELLDRALTGKRFHVYLNPQRSVDEGAFRVHGISSEFLQDKPLFQDVLQDFLAFIDGSEIIIHNAPFDVGFINAEFSIARLSKTLEDYGRILDTLVLARKKHPGQRNSLDALCKRYNIEHFDRALHGALLDAEILAHVYLVMTGGQVGLFDEHDNAHHVHQTQMHAGSQSLSSESPVLYASDEELQAHKQFIHWMIETYGVDDKFSNH